MNTCRACRRTAVLGAFALAAGAACAQDPRIRDIRYSPDRVFVIQGHVGYATSVFFDEGEEVVSVAIGDDAWQVAPEGNRLSLKPRGDDPYPEGGALASEADTNMTVWTDRRVYFFDLRAVKVRDPLAMTYAVRFRYPPDPERESEAARRQARIAGRAALGAGALGAAGQDVGDAADAGVGARWHRAYSWTGSAAVRPLRAFDDGTFTYFRFRPDAPLPAVYAREDDGQESIVNLHVRGDWAVIHRVASGFLIRDGALVACVFREPGPTGREGR